MLGRMEVDEERQIPPALPPMHLGSPFKEFDFSAQELEPLPLRSLLDDGYQIRPPIIRLNGHTTSAAIPLLEQFMEDVPDATNDTNLYIILDLRTVDSLETCVAQFLNKRASWLLLAPRHRTLVVIASPRSTRVVGILEREGLVLRWPTSNPDLADTANATAPLHILAYEHLDHAVHASRTVHTYTTGLGTVDKADDTTACDDHQIIEQLFSYLPDPQLAASERLRRAGLVVRTIRQGEAISCARYPLRCTFVVLNGTVGIRRLHVDPMNYGLQKPVREATFAALKSLFVWLFRQKNRCTQTNNAVEKYMGVGEKFDGGIYYLSCVHAVSESCWILDIDPMNEVGWNAVQKRSKRATKLQADTAQPR
jgi:hypothetical protein